MRVPFAWNKILETATVSRQAFEPWKLPRDFQDETKAVSGNAEDTITFNTSFNTSGDTSVPARILYQIFHGGFEFSRAELLMRVIRRDALSSGTTDLPKAKLANASVTGQPQVSASYSESPIAALQVISGVNLGAPFDFPGKQRSAALDLPAFVGINRTWRFDPGIPRDGSFAADLTLFYDPEVLPDDPNFDESKLEMISFDPATGVIERLPSRLDKATRSVTARVDRLAPYYSLAVYGPFTRSLLGAPALSAGGGFDAGLTVVNPDTEAVAIQARGFNPGAVDLPINLAPGQQVAGVLNQLAPQTAKSPLAWLTARAGVNMVAAQLLYAGTAFDVLPVQSAAAFAVFPMVRRQGNASTQFHIANPEPVDVQVDLGAYDLDGKLAAKLSRVLGPSEKMQLRVEEAFQSLPSSFGGYVTLKASRGVYAASVYLSRDAMAGANAQSFPAGARGAARLLAPYLGDETATLGLVNLSEKEARVTVRGYLESGAASSAGPIELLLAPARRFNRRWLTRSR